jgi:hypothetical protein
LRVRLAHPRARLVARDNRPSPGPDQSPELAPIAPPATQSSSRICVLWSRSLLAGVITRLSSFRRFVRRRTIPQPPLVFPASPDVHEGHIKYA